MIYYMGSCRNLLSCALPTTRGCGEGVCGALFGGMRCDMYNVFAVFWCSALAYLRWGYAVCVYIYSFWDSKPEKQLDPIHASCYAVFGGSPYDAI